jgi:hypothetical protein
MTGLDVAWILSDQPELVGKLPIEKMNEENIAEVLRHKPQLKGILEKKKGRP